MYGPRRYMDDDDVIVCEHCGHREYPHIGPGVHTCVGMEQELNRRNKEFKHTFENGGRRCTIQIEVECFDSHDAITAAIDTAMSDVIHPVNRMLRGKIYSGGDSMFECTYKVIKL